MHPSAIKSSSFKRAVILSIFLHIVLFALIGFSNQLTGPKKTGMVHYVNLNFVSLPGGGGGGGGGGQPGPTGEKASPQAAAPKETMKELTVPQKAQSQAGSTLRHPVEKTPATKKPAPPKKTEISAPQPGATTTTAARGAETGQVGGSGSGEGGGGGSGLRIGVGEGPGGFGGGYGDPMGTSSFPYTYYLQIIIDRVSSNWFTATNNLDYSGEYQSVIYFKILRNGQVADLKIEQPSDLPALDLTARRAVELAAPFPPLPRDFESEYLVVHLIFERSK